MLRRYGSFLLISFLFSNTLFGQDNADFMRSIGKIYVVVAGLVAIFIGIVLFLIYIERKVSKLENLSNYNDNE